MSSRAVVHSDRAPKAIGPYSQAIKVGDMVFCSGQVAIDPATGKLVEGDVVAQTRQVLSNLQAVLEAAGAGWAQVARTTIYLADLGDFARVNEVYGGVFEKDPPARATVQVAALPLGARVEIDAIAVV